METYNKKIGPNPDFEVIHLSQEEEDSAAAWAAKEKMPWPILLKDDQKFEKHVKPYFPSGRFGVPSYILVDREGKEVARGKSAVMSKLEESS